MKLAIRVLVLMVGAWILSSCIVARTVLQGVGAAGRTALSVPEMVLGDADLDGELQDEAAGDISPEMRQMPALQVDSPAWPEEVTSAAP